MFLPASVTDISPPVPADEAVNDGVFSESSSSFIQSSSSNETVLTTIMPHPKSSATSRRNSRQQKSSIITDEGEKRKRFPHLYESSSSESEAEMQIETDSDSVYDESSDSDIKAEDSSANNIPPVVSVDSFVIVKVYSKPLIYKSFEAQIICGPDKDNDYEVKFLKMSCKVKSGFIFSDIDDLASTFYGDFVCVLPTPAPIGQTARLANIFRFDKDLACNNV